MKEIDKGPRIFAAFILISLSIFLAWQIVSKAVGVNYASTDPQRALKWDPSNSSALLELAERQIAPKDAAQSGPDAAQTPVTAPDPTPAPDLAEARNLAERALRVDPLAPGALTDLARIAEAEGNSDRASALMHLAGNRALRDEDAQAWLIDDALSRADYAAVLPHLDAILRTHPDESEDSLPLVAAFVSYPDAVGLLEDLVRSNPPWRGWLLGALASEGTDRDSIGRFFADLEVGTNPLSDKEIQPYVDRLVKDGLFDQAYAAWTKTLPPGRGDDPATLYNGSFQYPLSGSAFDWKLRQSVGADTEVDDSASDGPVLRLEFSGARVDFQNVSHLIALPPGTYSLTGEVRAETLKTGRGLWWRVFCAGESGETLGQTDLVADSSPWHDFAVAFTVPDNDCKAQILRLELPARIELEKTISGVIYYRKLAVVPAAVAAIRGSLENTP